jgi:cyclic beta-1,2-glucan synthetase
MPQNTHLKIMKAESEQFAEVAHSIHDPEKLHKRANALANSLTWLPNTLTSSVFAERNRALAQAMKPIFRALDAPCPSAPISDDFRWLYDNGRLLYTELSNVVAVLKSRGRIPHVRTAAGESVPRVLAIAEEFIDAVGYEFIEQDFSLFIEIFQKTSVLELRELWTLSAALKLVLLEQVATRGKFVVDNPQDNTHGVGTCIRSLRELGQITWKDVLEPLVVIDQILRQDPAGAYANMDFESRDLYRNKLSNIAEHSDSTELEIAEAVLNLSREASKRPSTDSRVTMRESHVGYYLVDKGVARLHKRVHFRPPHVQKMQALLRRHPDEFFLLGIEIMALAIMAVTLPFLTDPYSPLVLLAFAMLVLFFPSSQSAIQVVNHLVTFLLTPQILPKLDFSEGVPDNCVTLVAVPSLLLNEKQVQGLAEDLEVRFLGNHDPNVHFALLTDLADSAEPAREDSPLINLCADLIRKLNDKYATQGMGSFFMFHRHRVYNPRERLWMGWERKRGKLLDLNKLLRKQYDSFPVKIGELSILPRVRFVITLDADTELPRGTAHRMIGTLAHPLNQAVIDPERNVVVEGYGILQPRVGVSVQSTTHSRLAAIYAGETGFDIYTRAVSDAYQDLYGEGSFTGKGIYEVDAVHTVLDQRFPRNALLSHDLIEGAYARAGLASDIEVIEDYPSHYSAYNRRKHRWLRGDWQIAGWLLPHVPEESDDRVSNPISLVSWWKIFDNLRRSLVEPAAFILLTACWFMPDGLPGRWTLSLLGVLWIPAFFSLGLNLLKAAYASNLAAAQDSLSSFFTASLNLVFTVTFLAHQALLSLDAVIRALIRRFFTQRRLLEWETAAEAEMGVRGKSPVDLYLDWTPVLALGIGILVWALRPAALITALPILILWAFSGLVSSWLNHPPRPARNQLSRKNLAFLRRAALHTWRYFAEYSTAEHNWLIPDNVQEQPEAIAARVSPTNIGLLLNARQVACEFGYLTVPEFAQQTIRTLTTVGKLKKYRGHVVNWYDTRTLEPLAPRFVSSVDNGNLLASLWTLQQGCLDRLKQPVLQPALAEGFLDYLRVLTSKHVVSRKSVAACERTRDTGDWLQSLLSFDDDVLEQASQSAETPKHSSAKWFVDEAYSRLQNVRQIVDEYAPWFSPEFATLRGETALNLSFLETIALQDLPAFIDELGRKVGAELDAKTSSDRTLYERFHVWLSAARDNVGRLISDLRKIAAEAGRMAEEMDFEFLLNKQRKLLSVGFDVETQRVHAACYDLLGTESRTAVFCAIVKEDIPQESWFLLGRAHTLDRGRPVLLSWTGTLFEYLMPSLWMRSYSNTLLDRSRVAAVRSQQAYAEKKGVPWGISESAYSKLDEAGNYQYYAFGLPHLALRKREQNGLVISPYSTFLSLDVDPAKAIDNLHKMNGMGWFGACGFYEAADFSAPRRFMHKRYQLVRCWMAHHQGMSLLALANFLNGNLVQKWFHAERRVQATELLLHEKPVAHVRRKDIPRKLTAA